MEGNHWKDPPHPRFSINRGTDTGNFKSFVNISFTWCFFQTPVYSSSQSVALKRGRFATFNVLTVGGNRSIYVLYEFKLAAIFINEVHIC